MLIKDDCVDHDKHDDETQCAAMLTVIFHVLYKLNLPLRRFKDCSVQNVEVSVLVFS